MQKRRVFSYLSVGFLLVYSLVVFYLRETCYRDPSSVFFRRDEAHALSYSVFRRTQSNKFTQDTEIHEVSKWNNSTAPQLCVAIGSVHRYGSSYLRETLGSLLEGLDELERQQIYLVVFLAHRNQTKHEDYGATWLRNMVDDLPAYPDDDKLLDLVEKLENDSEYPAHARKQKIDYSVLLSECAKVKPAYIMTLEDDLIALDGWYHRTLKALRTAVRKTGEMGRKNFLYLRVFQDGRLLGWNSEEWPRYLGFSILPITVELALILILRHTIRKPAPMIFILFVCGVCTPMSIGLLFAAGRSCVFPKQPGVHLMQKYGCCGQGLVYPLDQVVQHLLPLYRDTTDSHAAVDTFLEDYANANDELRWAVTPVLVQHVGARSSHDPLHRLGADDIPFDYSFETNDPVQLAREHQAWIDELKRGHTVSGTRIIH